MAHHYDWGPHDDGQRWVIASTTDSAAVHNSSTANRGCTLQTTASNHLTMAKDTKIARRANPTANALTTAARTFPTDGQLGQYIADNVHRLPLPMTPNSAGAPTSPTTSSLSPCAPHSRPTGAQRCRQRPVLARPWPRGSKSAGVITPRPTRSPRRAHVAVREEGPNVAKTAAIHAVLCCGVAACTLENTAARVVLEREASRHNSERTHSSQPPQPWTLPPPTPAAQLRTPRRWRTGTACCERWPALASP